MLTLNSTDLTFVAYGASTSHDGIMTVSQAKKLDELWNSQDESSEKTKLDGFCYIAYSGFGGYKGNSKEFFDWVFPQDFEIIKCDTRPTSDGKLILCHDPGFTLDGNGNITTYDSSNYTPIRSMTYAQAMALEFNNGEHVCDIDYYLQLCKTYGKQPYITARDEYADDIASALKTSLTYFGYHNNAIINSSTTATLTTVRNALPNVTLCVFCNPFGSSLVSALNYSLQTRDCIMSYYYSQGGYTWADFIESSDVASAIASCNQVGVRQCIGIESGETHIADIIAMGMDYCQYMAARPMPEYATNPTVVTVTGDTPTIALAEDNKIYKCTGTAITSLTITAVDTNAQFSVKFNSPPGNTPPTFNYPTAQLKMPTDFSLDVNTHYEFNVDEDGYVVVGDAWVVTT
jgi:glycerophosphoryl diester phosphodiesterase